MKLEDTAPPRFEEEGPDALRALVRGHQVGPTDAALTRMSKVLDEAVAAGAMSSGSAGPRGSRGLLLYKLGALVLVVAGGLVFSWRQGASPRAPSGAGESTLAEEAPKGAPLAAARETPVANPPPATEADVVPAASAAIAVDSLPAARGPSERRGTVVPPSKGAIDERSTSVIEQKPEEAGATELDLIQRAQTALLSDPRRALALTSEHARVYPAGEFVQEREVLAVEALMKLGLREDGARRARLLTERFPNTPYATRLEKAMGHPLSVSPKAPEPSIP